MRFLISLIVFLAFQPFLHAESELIGGTPAGDKYPEIVYIRSGNARCSATVISPLGETGVIMTAGHCVANDGEIGPVAKVVAFTLDGKEYSALCKQAPLYRSKKEDHDMALCVVDGEFDIEPASISLVGPKIGENVVLTGYGCTDSDGNGGNDKILRIGKAPVTQLPRPAKKDHWFYTDGASTLCYGDSGGPSLLDREKHLVIGVNSRGDIQTLSLLTALYEPASVAFFKEFAKAQHVEICGITKKC